MGTSWDLLPMTKRTIPIASSRLKRYIYSCEEVVIRRAEVFFTRRCAPADENHKAKGMNSARDKSILLWWGTYIHSRSGLPWELPRTMEGRITPGIIRCRKTYPSEEVSTQTTNNPYVTRCPCWHYKESQKYNQNLTGIYPLTSQSTPQSERSTSTAFCEQWDLLGKPAPEFQQRIRRVRESCS